jgi:hypothetical protein
MDLVILRGPVPLGKVLEIGFRLVRDPEPIDLPTGQAAGLPLGRVQ